MLECIRVFLTILTYSKSQAKTRYTENFMGWMKRIRIALEGSGFFGDSIEHYTGFLNLKERYTGFIEYLLILPALYNIYTSTHHYGKICYSRKVHHILFYLVLGVYALLQRFIVITLSAILAIFLAIFACPLHFYFLKKGKHFKNIILNTPFYLLDEQQKIDLNKGSLTFQEYCQDRDIDLDKFFNIIHPAMEISWKTQQVDEKMIKDEEYSFIETDLAIDELKLHYIEVKSELLHQDVGIIELCIENKLFLLAIKKMICSFNRHLFPEEAEILDIFQHSNKTRTLPLESIKDRVQMTYTLLYEVHNLPKPIISLVTEYANFGPIKFTNRPNINIAKFKCDVVKSNSQIQYGHHSS